MNEARRALSEMSRCFAEHGAEAEPVFFGAHRRPAGVVLSYQRYLRMMDQLDDHMLAAEIRKRDRDDTGERIDLVDLIREQGFDPADFGIDVET